MTNARFISLVTRQATWLAVLVAMLGLALALVRMDRNFFHVDEALYSSWGLRIARGDLLLTDQPVDKPPAFFYLQALGFRLFGVSEIVAKLPSLAAGVVVVLAVYDLCRRSYGAGTAVLAAALVALNPYQIVYASSAFLDEAALAFAMGACAVAARRRALASGLALGLASCVKPQAGLYAPLVLWLLLVTGPSRARRAGTFLLGAGMTLGAAVAWSLARPGPPFWVLGQEHLPLHFVEPASYASRAVAWWLDGVRWLVAHPLNQGLLVVAVLSSLATSAAWGARAVGRGLTHGAPFREAAKEATARPTASAGESVPAEGLDAGLALFVALYYLWHVVISFPVWDRYVVLLAPAGLALLARLLSRVASWLWGRSVDGAVGRAAGTAVVVVPLLVMALVARDTVLGRVGINGPGLGPNVPYESFQRAVNYLRAAAPDGAVVYDYLSFSWHYGYFLRDDRYPTLWFDLDHLPSAVDHMRGEDRPKFLILSWRMDGDPVLDRLREAAVVPEAVYVVYSREGRPEVTVYRLWTQER
ncbi:MAG TPA: glycosyltransferase family 39 protein [Chloroflexota bacterium]